MLGLVSGKLSELRFGIIGLSPDNGHPYSWSAIFNGYNPESMAQCPFPAIPKYLKKQCFPKDGIADASVTHVWTQDRAISTQIAAAACISHVVDEPDQMIGAVDGVLLARDDAENHLELAAPFLDAGLPIYIDKPLALSVGEAERLYGRQLKEGQIFTCSALAYAREFCIAPKDRADLGRLLFVEASTIKDWDRYAVHVLEPLQMLVADEGTVVSSRSAGRHARHLDLVWESGVEGRVTAHGGPYGGISIRLFGERGWREMTFSDSFSAFRSALNHFTSIVLGREPPQEPSKVLEIVRLIEAGRVGL